jgi:ribA/ribD-fused uncharacterized protein
MKRIHFWGNYDENGYLSNWYNAIFNISGILVQNSEQAYMLAKAAAFFDTDSLEKMKNTPDPKAVKLLGRQVKNFDEVVWNELKIYAMYSVNLCKFTQNLRLLELLYDTKGNELVEASPRDLIWGSGLTKEQHLVREAAGDFTYPGLNLLGKTLTSLRDNLLAGQISPIVEQVKLAD